MLNSEYKFKKLAVVVHVLQTTQTLVISRCSFAEDGKEMYKELKRTCTAIVLLIKLLFSDVRVAVAVVVFLNSLMNAARLLSLLPRGVDNNVGF